MRSVVMDCDDGFLDGGDEGVGGDCEIGIEDDDVHRVATYGVPVLWGEFIMKPAS